MTENLDLSVLYNLPDGGFVQVMREGMQVEITYLDWSGHQQKIHLPLKTAAYLFDLLRRIMDQVMSEPATEKPKRTPFEESIIEQIGESWARVLLPEFEKEYMQRLMRVLAAERKKFTIYPESENVFRAFRETPLEKVRVVILGQDPYHTPGMAHGLAFSVPEAAGKIPPSLANIFKELDDDLGPFVSPPSPDLTPWARQGVLLLNTCLTVRRGVAESHAGIGWETFTNEVVSLLGRDAKRPLVFVLWGKHAASFEHLIDRSVHEVVKSPHPSPMAAYTGFFGSCPFSRVNDALVRWGTSPIQWNPNPRVAAATGT